MRARFWLLVVAFLLMAPPPRSVATTPGPVDPSAVAFRRAAELQRGINLSNWFASTADLSAEHIAKQTTSVDLKFIHDLGFTYVRLGVDPRQFLHNGFSSPDTTSALSRLDGAIDEILAAHLAVSLAVFPNEDYKKQLSTEDGAEHFIYLWRMLAQHYSFSDPEHVFFEIINEPEVSDPYRWDGLQAATIDAIRGVDARHTIIATGSSYSSLPELLRIQPVRDSNVIYNFHFYEPYPFTHQGASWGSFDWNFFKDIPYPATPETLREALAGVPSDSARYELYLYGASGWNRAAILGRLQFARAWADERHVPLICNEFGAFRDTAPYDSRMRYLRDVRTSLEELHIGWSMWDYSGNFGLVRHAPDGAILPDNAAIEALGLNAPHP